MLRTVTVSVESYQWIKRFFNNSPAMRFVFRISHGFFRPIFQEVNFMFGTFWALVPPIIAIGLALITKEVYSSLFIGAVAGALFYAGFHVEALDSLINEGVVAAISDNAGIFMFLVLLGILVALLNKAGGSAAFGAWAKTHIKTRGGAMFATFLLGVLIFVDDYFNCLTVGSVMRPVTDSHRVSRAKLAYLIDATAAPICMIAPISSWAAAVSGVVEDYSGFDLFVRAIPFNFYSLLTIVMVLSLCKIGMDYGPMRRHELNAIRNNDLFTEGDHPEAVEEVSNSRAKVIDLLLPIIVLVVLCVGGLIYSGYLNGADNLIDAFANCDAFFGLPWGAIVALVFTVIYFVARRVISFKDAMGCIPQGFCAMVPAILILTLATSLKNMTSLLGAKEFVAGLMDSASKGLYSLLPAVIYLVACGLAFATGTSWGTFGILIPIVTEVFKADFTLMIVGVSACLAGAVFGDHVSPISDTTIMASAGAQCNHINHVSTQFPYAATVAAVAFVTYIIAGFIPNAVIVLPIGIVLMLITLFVIRGTITRRGAEG